MPLDDTEKQISLKIGVPTYEADPDKCDVIIVMLEGTPVVIVPNSERAKALFTRWGAEPEVIGIDPPADVMDLLNSMPANWLVEIQPLQEGAHFIQKITLPQPLVVVH